MDRTRLSEAIIHDLAAAFADELRAITIDPTEDLETIERRLQAMGRRVFGPVASALVRVQGETLARPDACALCGQPVRLVGARRPRRARGLVGDLTLERATSRWSGRPMSARRVDTG